MVIDFSNFYDLSRELDRFFDETSRPLFFSQRRVAYPMVNVAEDDQNYYVDVNLPGVASEEFELTLTDKNLVVKGERKPAEGHYYRRERLHGVFQRIVAMGAPVDRDKVAARFKDGVLHVTLPKSEAVKPRKIAIDN
jgi:HSP20 family protein